MDLKTAQHKTIQLSQKFPTPMNKKSRALDLMEEVGELANAILITEGDKPSNRAISKDADYGISDSLCDILYDVFMLAEDYKVDLSEKYPQVLEHIETRVKSGEFNSDK